MDEFWTQDKLLWMIGLFQFGLILVLFTIINVSQRILGKPNMSNDNSQNEIPSAAIAASRLNAVIKNQETDQTIGSEINNLLASDLPELKVDTQVATTPASISAVDLYKVVISPELFTELLEISNNPAETVDEAIRWWLRRRTLNALDSSIDRRDRDRFSSRAYSTKRSSQELWND